MAAVSTAGAKAHLGFVGDCHSQPLGPRQLLVVRQEPLDVLGVAPWQVRANVAVRGLAEEDLDTGVVLRLGSKALVRITHLCEVCKVLRRYVPEEAFPSLPGQRGSLGVFLTSGDVTLGDPVRVESQRYPAVPEQIYDRFAWIVAHVPRGHVVTYDLLLRLLGGAPSYVRVFPSYLKRAQGAGLPAHRVLDSRGTLVRHLPDQRRALEVEGVDFDRRGRPAQATRWDGRDLYLRPLPAPA